MWRDEAHLLDILIAGRLVLEFSRDLTWEQFQQSHLHQHAIAKALENIGEAARKVSDGTKISHPAIPWPEIVAMRHRIAHDYFRLDLTNTDAGLQAGDMLGRGFGPADEGMKVWEIVTNDIPALITAIEPLVPPEQE
ncbi:MAG: DUF86 domain-containing protein [Candidatus Schekmanbacteria bacterium]|nr:DUF86 domain-containing protein [Candidatus Schekmanbacteria bacterium]